MCHAGRHAYGESAEDFRCHDPSSGQAQNFCGGRGCYWAGDCDPGESCVDTHASPTLPMGKICRQERGYCVSNAIAEAVYGYSPSDFLPACDKGCFAGQTCEVGWRPGFTCRIDCDTGPDSDGDGTSDVCDLCPTDTEKVDPGICGCGAPDTVTDADGDGTADCVDGCPADPAKVDPGICGCGIADADTDGDGLADCVDPCALDPLNDADGDGLCADIDLCPGTLNPEPVPTVELGVNRSALVDGNGLFDTTLPPGGGGGPGASFALEDKGGCSCAQIIAALGLGEGHTTFGCSRSAKILAFILDLGTARALRKSLELPAQEPEPLAHPLPETFDLVAESA